MDSLEIDAFITEVKNPPEWTRNEEEIRSPECPVPNGASEVFRVVDRMNNRSRQGRSLRSVMRKAAQKTILVIRAKNATQDAEGITIRFDDDKITDIPRSSQLPVVLTEVIDYYPFASPLSREIFQELSKSSSEFQNLMRDLFWYLTATFFQKERSGELRQRFHNRIADTFTYFFLNLNSSIRAKSEEVLDVFPDIVAQVLFRCLYSAYPKSRKMIEQNDFREEIARTCYRWIRGMVPSPLDCSHWLPLAEESPKQSVVNGDFPALKNRMARAERIERAKVATTVQLGIAVEPKKCPGISVQDGAKDSILPEIRFPSTSGNKQDEIRMRGVYELQNSPLVASYLDRRQIQANAAGLKVKMRLSSSHDLDTKCQGGMRRIPAPRWKHRRLVSTETYAEMLRNIESLGNDVRLAHQTTKAKVKDDISKAERSVKQSEKVMKTTYSQLKQNQDEMHALSNLLTSQARIDSGYGYKTDIKSLRSYPCKR